MNKVEVLKSVKNALTILLDDAEKRNYNPPVPSLAIAELEYVVAELSKEN